MSRHFLSESIQLWIRDITILAERTECTLDLGKAERVLYNLACQSPDVLHYLAQVSPAHQGDMDAVIAILIKIIEISGRSQTLTDLLMHFQNVQAARQVVYDYYDCEFDDLSLDPPSDYDEYDTYDEYRPQSPMCASLTSSVM